MRRYLYLFILACCFTFPAFAQEVPSLRLGLSKTFLHLRSGEVEEAFEVINGLKAKYPNNPEVLAAEAELYFQTGNRALGLALLEEAERLAPGNEDIKEQRRIALLAVSPHVRVEREIVERGDIALEQFTRVQGEVGALPTVGVGAVVEQDNIRTVPITRANGNVERFHGSQERAELYLTKSYENGNQSKASLFVAEAIAGIGGSYTWFDKLGHTTLSADLYRPDWLYVEQVIDRGHKSDVKASRMHRIASRLTFDGNAAVNRYGLRSDNDVASSASFEANLRYAFAPVKVLPALEKGTYFNLQYTVDAEYPFEVEAKRNSAGLRYEPLPLTSREIHFLTVGLSQEIASRLRFEGYAGYAVDRLGGDGPSMGASLSYQPMDRLFLEVRGAHSIVAEQTTEKLDRLGVNAKWIF